MPPPPPSLRMAEIFKGLVSWRGSGAVCRRALAQNNSQLTRQLARRHHSLGIAECCHEAAGVCVYSVYTQSSPASRSQHHRATLIAPLPPPPSAPDSNPNTGAAGSILNPSCPGMSPSTKISWQEALGQADARADTVLGLFPLLGRLHPKVSTSTLFVPSAPLEAPAD